jgi:uncharacterized protein
MPDQHNFIKTQIEFTQHIRDPENNPQPKGIEDRRMAIYRDLVYNNVESFIAGGFPVLRSIYSDNSWHKMVRDFLARHKCHTPYFLEISQEFLAYLQNDRQAHNEDPAGLLELAHYEWVELALTIAEDETEFNSIDSNGDLLENHPVLSNLAWSLTYSLPVHQMSADFLPEQAETPTHLVVYRDRLDEVHFMEINAVTARLLQLINDMPGACGKEILHIIANELQADVTVVMQGGLISLQELQSKGIILGTNK